MFQRKPRPFPAKKTPPPLTPEQELMRALIDAGQIAPSACGTCGGTVRADDPEAVQNYRQVGTWGVNSRRVRSWRYHRVCSLATSGPELLALALDPDARPVRVTQAHYDVTQQIGAPLAYQETENASSSDRGQRPWKHVPRAELTELRAAVEKRHRELTEPAPHSSGYPCGVCGRSHEAEAAWSTYQGRPACGECSRLVQRAKVPGNRGLSEYALDAARPSIPERADLSRFGLARDMPSYRPLALDERREPWTYVADLPEVPPTPEERLAELEKRLVGVTG